MRVSDTNRKRKRLRAKDQVKKRLNLKGWACLKALQKLPERRGPGNSIFLLWTLPGSCVGNGTRKKRKCEANFTSFGSRAPNQERLVQKREDAVRRNTYYTVDMRGRVSGQAVFPESSSRDGTTTTYGIRHGDHHVSIFKHNQAQNEQVWRIWLCVMLHWMHLTAFEVHITG